MWLADIRATATRAGAAPHMTMAAARLMTLGAGGTALSSSPQLLGPTQAINGARLCGPVRMHQHRMHSAWVLGSGMHLRNAGWLQSGVQSPSPPQGCQAAMLRGRTAGSHRQILAQSSVQHRIAVLLHGFADAVYCRQSCFRLQHVMTTAKYGEKHGWHQAMYAVTAEWHCNQQTCWSIQRTNVRCRVQTRPLCEV